MSKVIRVQFPQGSSLYDYLWDEELSVGSYVVVDGRSSYTIAIVVECLDLSENASKWIVCPVDDARYKERIQREQRAKVLRRELEKRLSVIHEMKKFELLSSDPEAKAMLDELEQLK